MPETPDFDQIARQAISGSEFHIKLLAEQLRQVWNARGAADLAAIENEATAQIHTRAELAEEMGASRRDEGFWVAFWAILDRALRKLDR
jgi:hypothetical protein